MNSAITGNSILDFVLIQTMSIYYQSDAALRIIKNSEDQDIKVFAMPPVIAWYNKAASAFLKNIIKNREPSIKTTGYSIQTFSRLYNVLSAYDSKAAYFSSFSPSQIKSMTALQLQFCLEYLEKNICSPGEQSAVLEGGSYFLDTFYSDEEFSNYISVLQGIHSKLHEIDLSIVNTMDLASVLRGISAWLRYTHFNQKSDFLSSLALEILNRRSRTGLFCLYPNEYVLAARGQQFFILDSLLQSYPFIQLDHVLEESFLVFNILFRLSYKDNIKLFAFTGRKISYTAFDVGALLSCLSNVSHYVTNEYSHEKSLNEILNRFVELLLESYYSTHKKDIKMLLKRISLSNKIKTKLNMQLKTNTVFPKRIYLTYPYLEFNWGQKGIIDQTGIFFLCASMLSLIDNNNKIIK